MKTLLYSFLILSGPTLFAQHKRSDPFPEIPSGGIALAQTFDSKVTDPSQYTAHLSKVCYIWGALKAEQPAGVIASKYFPSIRTPDKKLSIAWYQEHHPDWVMYQEDRITPAYGYVYSYGGLTPLDVSNPEVQEFYFNTFILPAVKSGYKMVAMDNVDLGNWPKSAGHFKGKEWVQLYTGKKDDPVFQQNMISWMQYLSAKLRPLGVRVSANIKATTASAEVILKVIDAVDMWVDENGFCHRGENITGAAWKKAFLFLRKVAPVKAYVSINQVKGLVPQAPAAQIEWVLANYLLSRGPQSLLALAGYGKTTVYHYFDYRKEMDVAIGEPVAEPEESSSGAWIRPYTRGLCLVNPSAVNVAAVQLPKGKWKTLQGNVIENEVNMDPASGLVLTR
ncbi:hypothetical protein HDC92_002045 [Pedobacter sp. AK017]|uniref:putative glycoside hydrolase n=1 Tax=Pedobacter sp. AK017 TaxID=2723073 RepID=UPI00160735D0|nr:putative glycoside hydrolase [Pedobacter sp. AK017]MBB5438369.1 hypothetical protein [Pedobacter sp. AK017]